MGCRNQVHKTRRATFCLSIFSSPDNKHNISLSSNYDLRMLRNTKQMHFPSRYTCADHTTDSSTMEWKSLLLERFFWSRSLFTTNLIIFPICQTPSFKSQEAVFPPANWREHSTARRQVWAALGWVQYSGVPIWTLQTERHLLPSLVWCGQQLTLHTHASYTL